MQAFLPPLFTAMMTIPLLAAEDDPFASLREEMVRTQLTNRGIKDQRVLAAMGEVKREKFMPQGERDHAYHDSPRPIGHGQTISQPYIVGFMTEVLNPKPGDKVLEVGTGLGYQAAVLSKLLDQVYTIEIVKPLAEEAAKILETFPNIHARHGDGYLGWQEAAPFNAILVACAPDHIPQPLVDQLKEGGRLIIPVGEAGAVQELVVVEKRNGEAKQTKVLGVRFVPMIRKGEDGGS